MGDAANWTPDRSLFPTAPGAPASDSLVMRLRWRLMTRPERAQRGRADLRINGVVRAVDQQALLGRWRPLSAPAQPVPPWRWPGRARAERASRRAAISERWRPITAR
ncbi:MAG TPA: hypothetical protein VH599_09275 [Ktedonobacterales bacterium]